MGCGVGVGVYVIVGGSAVSVGGIGEDVTVAVGGMGEDVIVGAGDAVGTNAGSAVQPAIKTINRNNAI